MEGAAHGWQQRGEGNEWSRDDGCGEGGRKALVSVVQVGWLRVVSVLERWEEVEEGVRE
jgi:hypothetical protein